MQKLLKSLTCALVMALCLCQFVMAADSSTNITVGTSGNITVVGQTEPNENINIIVEKDGKNYYLNSIYADASGDYTVTISLPEGTVFNYVITSAGTSATGTVDTTDTSSGGSTGGGSSSKSDTVTVKIYGVADDVTEGDAIFDNGTSNFSLWASETIKIYSGDSAWDAVRDALDEADLSYSTDGGSYITEIDGLEEFERGANSGWQYTVNGDYPDVSMDDVTVEDGDKIVVHYTDDYTQEDADDSTTSSGSSNQTDTTTTAQSFGDVTQDDWYYDAVDYVVENGLFNGTSDTAFAPDDTMTRAMIWTVLARVAGEDTTTDDSWYAVGMDWASEMGISDGTDPDGSVTREQLATMLYRYAVQQGNDVSVGENTNILSYEDVMAVDEYAISAMQWACGAGIVKGDTDSTLNPDGVATRAQVATIMMRYLEL